MVIDELHAAAKAGSGAAAMAPSPLVEAPAPAASEPASLNTLWGGRGRLTYPPSDGSRPRLTNPCVGGWQCFHGEQSSESRRNGVRSRNSLHSDVERRRRPQPPPFPFSTLISALCACRKHNPRAASQVALLAGKKRREGSHLHRPAD